VPERGGVPGSDQKNHKALLKQGVSLRDEARGEAAVIQKERPAGRHGLFSAPISQDVDFFPCYLEGTAFFSKIGNSMST